MGGDAVHTFLLILRREFLTRVRGRFFQVGTLVLVALVVGYIVLQALVIGHATTTVKMGFTGTTEALAQPLGAAVMSGRVTVQAQQVESVASGEALVRSGDLDAVVSGDPAAPRVAFKDQFDPTVAAALDGLVKQVAFRRALAGSGVDPATIAATVAAAGAHRVALDPNAGQRNERVIVGIFVAAVLYMALQLYGSFVATGVVEEKSNRIIEILLSTVRPRQLLFGKVVGIGLVGLIQLVIVGAVALVAVARTQVVSLPAVGATALLGGLLWFVLGFTFYALIYAAGGSMVSRQEDLGSVTAPISILTLGPYLAFFWVIANPDSKVAVALSMLPPFSPVMMPARMATGDAQPWQVVVAVLLMLAAIAGLNALAARIYSNSVLRIGSRVRLADAWRSRN